MKGYPWECGPSVSPSEYGVTIVNSHGEIVCSTYEEHAAVLCAAPEMLEALKEAYEAMREPHGEWKDVRENKALPNVRAAIAKAEGSK